MLAAVAAHPADDEPRRVLADYWLDHGESDRGLFVQAACQGLVAHCHALLAEHGLHWFEPLWASGFSIERLELERGFVRPLVLAADDPLAHHPQLFRISPIVYRLDHHRRYETVAQTWLATKWGSNGCLGEVLVRTLDPMPHTGDPIGREREILERFDHPTIPKISVLAQTKLGTALVFDEVTTPVEVNAAREVAAIGQQIAEALAALHARGVIHGWLERSRIGMTSSGPVLEGLADATCELEPVDADYLTYDPRPRTYRYLAAEQVLGRPPTAAVDVWALAMILAELVAGRHPVASASDFDALVAIRDGNFTAPDTRTPLGRVLRDALARRPEDRPTAGMFAAQLAGLG